jgi:hypothetical protein
LFLVIPIQKLPNDPNTKENPKERREAKNVASSALRKRGGERGRKKKNLRKPHRFHSVV